MSESAFIAVLIVTVLLHALITGGTVMIWNSVKKTTPLALPKVFFASIAVRLFSCALVFACSLFFIHDDIERVKILTVVSLAAYFLMLIFDTAYFYCSSQQFNKNSNQ